MNNEKEEVVVKRVGKFVNFYQVQTIWDNILNREIKVLRNIETTNYLLKNESNYRNLMNDMEVTAFGSGNIERVFQFDIVYDSDNKHSKIITSIYYLSEKIDSNAVD
ncbi:MAG: hypothetical protein WCR54_07800 [Clostridia bacterium]